jgi:hypothetical protein
VPTFRGSLHIPGARPGVVATYVVVPILVVCALFGAGLTTRAQRTCATIGLEGEAPGSELQGALTASAGRWKKPIASMK